jgi:hypothetical protein
MKRCCDGACDGVWRSVRLAGGLSQTVGFVLVHLAAFICTEDVFTFNLLYKNYKYCEISDSDDGRYKDDCILAC